MKRCNCRPKIEPRYTPGPVQTSASTLYPAMMPRHAIPGTAPLPMPGLMPAPGPMPPVETPKCKCKSGKKPGTPSAMVEGGPGSGGLLLQVQGDGAKIRRAGGRAGGGTRRMEGEAEADQGKTDETAETPEETGGSWEIINSIVPPRQRSPRLSDRSTHRSTDPVPSKN